MSVPNPHDFAVIIGINDYHYPNKSLTSPVDDARAISEWLQDHEGGGLHKDNCKVVLGTEDDTADQVVIENQLIEAKKFAKLLNDKNKKARRLYFYFSGHGVSKDTEVLMCHALWSVDRPNATLNADELEKKYINPCTLFDEVVIWLDCCRSRSLITHSGSFQIGCSSPCSSANTQKTMFAYATLDHTEAYEALNESSDYSIFTQALLTGLKYGMNNGSANISWRSLKKYLEEYVPQIAAQNGTSQTPQITFPRLTTKDDPIFCKALVPTVRIIFNVKVGTVDILEGINLTSVLTHDLLDGVLEAELPYGKYIAFHGNKKQVIDISGEQGEINVQFD